MGRIVRAFVVVLVAIAPSVRVAVAAGQAASSATGIIAGRTVDAATGAPVADVLLGLSQRTGPSGGSAQPPVAPNTQLLTVLTDGEGRFVFRDLPKGSFLLLATAPGFVITTYGQGRPNGPSRTIDLDAGDRTIDLSVPLWRHGVISGEVSDEANEPVVGVTVRALRRVANGPGGTARFTPATETTTDDRGRYRLAQLTPGTFLVSVPQTQVTLAADVVDTYVRSLAGTSGSGAGTALLELMSSRTPIPSAGGGVRLDSLILQSSGSGRLITDPPTAGDGAVSVYRTTLYGAAGADASRVEVAAGEERSGVDIHLAPVRTTRVSGSVVAEGEPASHLAVRLVPLGGPPLQSDADFEAAMTMTDGAGHFDLVGVPPGRYVIKVIRAPRLALPPGLAANPAVVVAYGAHATGRGVAAPSAVIGAALPMVVGEDGASDVTVVLRSGATVAGRVDFDADSPAPTAAQLQNVGVLLSADGGGNFGAGLQVARLAPDNTFRATPPAPGRYSPTVAGVPPGWTLGAIDFEGRPLAAPIDLGGDDVSGVVIRFTRHVSTLAGTVRVGNGAPATRAEIVVFAADPSARTVDSLNPRQPRIQQASNAGVFRVTGLLPGDYFVAAVDDGEVPEIADPGFFDAITRFATRVTLAGGDVRTIDPTVGRIR